MAAVIDAASTLPEWLQPAYQSFVQMRAEERLPHALIINCPQGWGETRLASIIATQLLETAVRETAAELAHPDLHWLRIEENSLLYKVAQVREAVGFMQRTAAGGGYKVIVLPQAQRMNEESANTLLKSLEEPPAGGLWLLLCSDLGQLLPTIRSRCQLISIRPGAASDSGEFIQLLLRESGAEDRWSADAGLIAMLRFELGGAPELVAGAISADEEPIWPALQAAIANPESIGDVSQNWQSRALAELLGAWLRYVHSILAAQTPEYLDPIDLSAAARGKWFEFAEELTRSRALATRHVGINGRLLLDRLLGRWVALFDSRG